MIAKKNIGIIWMKEIENKVKEVLPKSQAERFHVKAGWTCQEIAWDPVDMTNGDRGMRMDARNMSRKWQEATTGQSSSVIGKMFKPKFIQLKFDTRPDLSKKRVR